MEYYFQTFFVFRYFLLRILTSSHLFSYSTLLRLECPFSVWYDRNFQHNFQNQKQDSRHPSVVFRIRPFTVMFYLYNFSSVTEVPSPLSEVSQSSLTSALDNLPLHSTISFFLTTVTWTHLHPPKFSKTLNRKCSILTFT